MYKFDTPGDIAFLLSGVRLFVIFAIYTSHTRYLYALTRTLVISYVFSSLLPCIRCAAVGQASSC
jgi:hypothetical protein